VATCDDVLYLVEILYQVERMRDPQAPGVDPSAKSLRKLEGFLLAYLDAERAAEVQGAIRDLMCVPDLRNGIAHGDDDAARRAAKAARHLRIPTVITDYPLAFDRLASAVISAT
jgi:hypothetical protein